MRFCKFIEVLSLKKTHLVYLDGENNVIGNQMFTLGLPSESFIPFHIISKSYKKLGAKSFYVAHNHPSGGIEITDGDKSTTKMIAELAVRDNLNFIGHIILNHNKYSKITYSLNEEGKN